jgi:hypothetical protein
VITASTVRFEVGNERPGSPTENGRFAPCNDADPTGRPRSAVRRALREKDEEMVAQRIGGSIGPRGVHQNVRFKVAGPAPPPFPGSSVALSVPCTSYSVSPTDVADGPMDVRFSVHVPPRG